MAYKTFSIDDFSGGLNTAVAPSRLDPRFSPDIRNVDFTDTGALTRRKGYRSIAGTTFPDAVYGLYRYYQTDGDRYWVVISGTNVYSQTYVATEVPLTRLEAEDATWTTDPTDTSGQYWSSGEAVYFGTANLTATVSIPYSTSITVGHNCYTSGTTTILGASLQVDGGSWVSATGPTYTLGGLSGTSHTLAIKVPSRNSTSGKLVATGASVQAFFGRTVNDGGVLSVRFYDTMAGSSWYRAGVAFGSITQHYYACAVSPYANYRVYRPNGAFVESTVARSAGWHTIEFDPDGWVSIDGVDVALSNEISSSDIGVYAYIDHGMSSTGTTTYYYDSLTRNRVPLDDFASTSEWANWGSALGSSFTASSTQADTQNWYYVDYFDYSAIGSFTSEGGSISASTDQYGFSTLNDDCYITTAYDRMLKFDGSSVVSATSVTATPPQGGFLIEHKRRLWTAGGNTDPALLSYSDVDEPEDWVGGGDIYLAGKDSGARCTGLTAFDNKIFYFSDSRIYAIDPTGPDTNWSAAMAGYNSISWSLGCIAPKTLVQTDNALIFLSADGVRAYGYIPGMYSQDGSGLIDLSENIRPSLDTISDAMKAKAAGAFYNGRYYLACALDGATENDTVFVYQLPQGNKPGAWTKYTGIDVASFHVTRGDEYGLYAGTFSGDIIQLETGTNDDGSAIEMYYKSPQLAPGGFEAIKHFRTLHIAAESTTTQNMTVGINTDDVEAADQTATFTSNTAAQPVRLSVSSRGRSIQYELTSSGAGQPLTVSRLTTSYHAQKAR